jgi:hypothetical protein
LLELLAAHPGGLTCAQAAELDQDPGLGGGRAARLQVLTRYGSRMRRLERAGLAARSGSVPGRQGKGAAIVWTIAVRGHEMLLAETGGKALRLLELLAAHPGGLTCAQAAELDQDPGLGGGRAARLQVLTRYGSRMRRLERAGLAARSEIRRTGSAGGPPVVWAITGTVAQAAGVALAAAPAHEGKGDEVTGYRRRSRDQGEGASRG